MNVFVLNSGRCGSTTFVKACAHIHNFTAAHESRVGRLGEDRLAYPDWHIEADNRLSWLLGRLDRAYGQEAFYVHLTRSADAVVNSFIKRADFGIMRAYCKDILLDCDQDIESIAADYLRTVTSNIQMFLRDKPRRMDFRLESAERDFPRFWEAIGARGDENAALAEWRHAYNASS